jgi:hypothetical protein
MLLSRTICHIVLRKCFEISSEYTVIKHSALDPDPVESGIILCPGMK